jgi:hypothetical protein
MQEDEASFGLFFSSQSAPDVRKRLEEVMS